MSLRRNMSPSPASQETRVRVVAGVALAALTVTLVYASVASTILLLTAAAVVMAWEWQGIVRPDGGRWGLGLHVGIVLAVGSAVFLGSHDVALGLVLLGTFGVLLAARPGHLEGWRAVGVLYTALPLIALAWLRADPEFGILAVLFVVFCVAATDTGAYFSGRALGGPKFAPRISPNKTWSGFLGGVGLAGLAAWGVAWGGDLPVPGWLAAFGVALGAISQMGDLFESFVKRKFGVKDASQIIPGHGGVMDRVDGLIFAALFAAFIALLRNPDLPGAGVLVWG